jgi:DNA-directed RNA polymerase subunit RPC12/RpoP
MKHKPTKFPLTKAALLTRDFKGLAIPAFLIDLHLASNNDDYWVCGNCSSPLRFRNGETPKVCAKCGNEIDWVGIKTTIIKVCPKCGIEGSIYNEYCERHIPAVKLVNNEIPL